MILIVVKWTIKPERSDELARGVAEFTQATRSEPGNIFFEWSRSVDDPHQFVLIEAFQDDAAAAPRELRPLQGRSSAGRRTRWQVTPQIISVQNVPGNGWCEMAEVKPR